MAPAWRQVWQWGPGCFGGGPGLGTWVAWERRRCGMGWWMIFLGFSGVSMGCYCDFNGILWWFIYIYMDVDGIKLDFIKNYGILWWLNVIWWWLRGTLMGFNWCLWLSTTWLSKMMIFHSTLVCWRVTTPKWRNYSGLRVLMICSYDFRDNSLIW